MKRYYIVLGLLIFAAFIGMNALYTPIPNTDDDSTFNTLNAIETIQDFSKEPHSVFDPIAHEDVRLYLVDTLSELLGSENVLEMNYDSSMFVDEIDYDVKNILATIHGESETGILIVAHYDSRGHIGRSGELGNSYGAADDGYGISVLLEIARLYGSMNLENSIYILMTDAEETGLYGAKMAADNEDLMANVGFVINIEARGVKGPAYMFETSVNNSKVIDFYKNANLPVSYSLATAVYTVMPNSTDFTEFLAEEKNGVNFAVLDNLYYYHTPHDNYTNINPSSIEHYGTQIIPMVDEFVMNEIYSDVDYFDSDSNHIFFTFLPNVFISYSEGVGIAIALIASVAFLGLVVLSIMKNKTKLKSLGTASLIYLSILVGAIILGNVVGRIVALFSKVPFNMTYVRTMYGGIPSLILLLATAVISYYIIIKRHNKGKMLREIVIIGTIINMILTVATSFILSGASFLFLIPLISGVIYLGLDYVKNNYVKQLMYGFIVVVNVMILVPILYSLYLALTVGGLLALEAILVFYLTVIIASIYQIVTP